DSAGNIEWQKGDTASNDDSGQVISIAQTPDGGFISGALVRQQLTVLKLTSAGDLQWEKILEQNVDNRLHQIIPTSDGGYILCGFINNQDNYEGLIIRLDAAGNTIWQKTYGGPSFDSLDSIVETGNGFAAVGNIDLDLWLIQIDQDGNLISSESLGGPSLDQARWITLSSDGSFLIVGRTYSFGAGTPGNPNAWLLKLYDAGQPIWQNVLDGNNYDDAFSITETQNGDLLVVGNEQSFGDPIKDIFLLRLDSNANPLWFRSYGGF